MVKKKMSTDVNLMVAQEVWLWWSPKSLGLILWITWTRSVPKFHFSPFNSCKGERQRTWGKWKLFEMDLYLPLHQKKKTSVLVILRPEFHLSKKDESTIPHLDGRGYSAHIFQPTISCGQLCLFFDTCSMMYNACPLRYKHILQALCPWLCPLFLCVYDCVSLGKYVWKWWEGGRLFMLLKTQPKTQACS